MIFIYAFYIDVFLEQNFLMNLIVLSLTNVFCKSPVRKRKLRMMAGALVGAFLSAVFFIFFPSYIGAVAGMVFFVVPVMLEISFGWHGKRHFFMCAGCSWLSIVILNGIATAVYNLTGIRSLYVYACVIVLLSARFLVQRMISSVRLQTRQMRLTIDFQGNSVTCMGLYDSGNLLQIPESAEPVHIIAPELLTRLFKNVPEEKRESRMVPYHALGTSSGWIQVYRIGRMQIEQGKISCVMESPWMGKADSILMKDRPYQVILNSAAACEIQNKQVIAKKRSEKRWES